MDETSSDEEYGPLASTWGDQAKDTSTDVIQAWRSLADPNAKLGPKGLGSGGLHRRGKNYIPVDEEVILKQREKTASMRPKSSKSKSTRSSNGSSSNISGKKQGPNEKKMPRAKNGVYKKEQTQPQQRQEPDHWNPFRSTSTPSPDSQPVWLKETAYSYFRSREKTLDDAGHRVPASWGDPLPLPTPQEEPTPSKSKSTSALFSDTTTNSMTSPPPSPPSSTSTASISRFELPSRRPPPKGSKFVWLNQPLSNQPFWEQPKVNVEKNNQRMEDAKASVMEKRTSWDQKMSTNQNQGRSGSKWEISQQQHNIEGSRVTNAEGRNVSEQPKADWGNTTLDSEKSKAPTTKPATKRRVRFNDNTIKPEYHEGKEEEIKSAPKWDNAKSYQQPKSQTQVDDSWGKTNFAAGPSAYDWKDVKQEVSDIVNNAEASSKTGSNGNKADVATSEWNKSTTAATSAASWNETTSSSWQQEAAATWYDTSQWNSATTFSPGTTTEWGNGVASDWNTSSNDNCGSTATTSADTWSSHKDVSTPQRFSRPERPKYSKRGTAPRPMNYRQDIPIAPPKEVAPPPSAENPVIVSINVELGPGQKIPIKIRLLDDTDRLAQEFAASHNITVPPIVDALRQLFSSQKRIAVKKRSRKM